MPGLLNLWLARSRVAAIATLSVVALAALMLLDVVNRPAAASAGAVASGGRDPQHRVLVLILDGLRYETAIDSTIMPMVAALRASGASGRVETVFEGFSIPAIQAAFSGRAETQLLNLVRNFRVRALPLESVFQDLMRSGGRSVVVGSEAFVQFGPTLDRRVPTRTIGDMYDQDGRRPAMTLAAYREEQHALVVCHYNTTDWVAHEFGIHRPEYRAGFRHADSIVADFAAARRPNDYLIVFGDHGHNEAGEHKTGMDIPTFGLFIGPSVRPGSRFASLPLGDLRLVVSHMLGLPLRGGAYHVDVLAPLFTDSLSNATAGTTPNAAAPAHSASRAPGEYLLAVAMLALLAWVARAVLPAPAAGDSTMTAAAFAMAALAFALELAAQRAYNAAWTLFPLLLLGVGIAMFRRDRLAGAFVTVVGAFFLSRLIPWSAAATIPIVPTGLATLIPLYAVAVVAKIGVLALIAGRRQWWLAGIVGGLLAVLGFRVVDHMLVFAGAIACSALWLWKARSPSQRQMAAVALGWCILYFTHRLPLYLYAWIDLFVAAFVLVHRARRSIATDALALTAAFTLTSGWLNGGIEWGFLYSTFPAYVVEYQVAWMVPLILLPFPILLVLLWWTTESRPSRTFVALSLLYLWIRVAAAWMVRLLGGGGEDVWPIAEQGAYVLVFVAAAVWASRSPQTPADARSLNRPPRPLGADHDGAELIGA